MHLPDKVFMRLQFGIDEACWEGAEAARTMRIKIIETLNSLILIMIYFLCRPFKDILMLPNCFQELIISSKLTFLNG